MWHKQLHKHLEWFTFGAGLLFLGLMNPETTGVSLCLFDFVGIDVCPGEGLGHSIAYTLRGDITAALQSHLAGPLAVVVLGLRILFIWKEIITPKLTEKKKHHG